jgi:hypothetical protein
VANKKLSNAAIAEGIKGWIQGHNLWKAMRNCPSLEDQGERSGGSSEQCCDHLSCEMQTQSQRDKCGYEVMASYQFLLGHLGLFRMIPGSQDWNAAFQKLSDYEKTTVLEIAINKALLVRCDIEIANKGILVEEVTDKYNKGELISTNTKQISNPAVEVKSSLSKINRELGKTINISERDKDDRKAKLKQFPKDPEESNSPMGNFMKVIGRAAMVPVPNKIKEN